MSGPAYDTMVWDLGGVLVDWDPRYLFRTLMPDDEVERFLAEVGFAEWNYAIDAGRPFAEAIAEHGDRYPHRRDLLQSYLDRFPETLGGSIGGSVELLDEVRKAGVRVLALTNWSAETFHHAGTRFDWLTAFDGIVVSGEERVAKPDRAIFELLIRRHEVNPWCSVYVDDNPSNVDAAAAVGFTALRFTTPERLRADLRRLGVIDR